MVSARRNTREMTHNTVAAAANTLRMGHTLVATSHNSRQTIPESRAPTRDFGRDD
jgi:hypothetical protein